MLPTCPDCQNGYQPDDNYCRNCGMFLAALRDTAVVAAPPALPMREARQRAALPAPVKKAATAMAVGTALQIGVSLTGKYLARQAGKQAVNAVVGSRSKPTKTSRAVTEPAPRAAAQPVDPYPHAAAVSETVVIRRVWIRR
jgi:predicted amidophosphoribosyltransferase